MDIIFASMHHIDLINEKAVPKILNNEDVKGYIKSLTEEALENKHKKFFKTTSNTSEVVATVKRIFTNKSLDDSDRNIIADRLVDKEIATQEKIDKLNIKIKKGSLIQSLFKKENNEYYFLIAKIESNRFLDTNDLIAKEGLLFENKAFKTCVFKINNNNEIEEISLSDNNNKIADYWSDLFLELKELTNDETNTKNAFKIVLNKIKNDLEVKHPQDYILIQNNAKSFFQTNSVFRQDEFMNNMFNNYEPQDSNLDINALRGSLIRAYNRVITDTEFNIIPKSIQPSIMKTNKQVNSFIELTLNGTQDQIQNNVFSVEENGVKYIKVKASNIETYNSFKWNEV